MPPDSDPTRVVLVGATGRMGGTAVGWIEAAEDLVLVARPGSGDDLARSLSRSEAQVGLDLTVAGLGAAHGQAMLAAGLRPVIGTSGVTPKEIEDLDRRAREAGLGGLVVPNFSLGIWLLQRASVEAAACFAHSEIMEMHSPHKQDSPSGTALDTARRMEAVGPKVPIHSLRLAGLHSDQEVIFGGPGEILRISHRVSSPECFEAGLLCSLRYAVGALGVGSGLDLAMESSGRAPGSGLASHDLGPNIS